MGKALLKKLLIGHQENVVDVVERELHELNKKFLINLLMPYRSLGYRLTDNANSVLKDLASMETSRYGVYPCDIIDLRSIFRDRIIHAQQPFILFPLRFSQKYLKEYSVFLIIDADKVSNKCYHLGGLFVFGSEDIDVHDKLIRVIVNETTAHGNFDQVKNMVNEYKMPVECLVSNTVPGVDAPLSTLSIAKKKLTKLSQLKPITLDPDEKSIFDLLVQIKKDLHLSTEFRVAGGWTRDKLLGVPSDDIDIAVSMPGYDVAKAISDYGKRKNIKEIGDAYRVSLEKSADPNQKDKQSDELMVGGISVLGKKIEFVPMRTESYREDSRTPSIVNTNDPRQDAKRRDLSINAMYYNIETQEVEDYVGGMQDLGLTGSPMVLKTPDDPTKTFLEDPLRVLRLLRFHSRYVKSVIDPKALEAIGNPSVQKAYGVKVSPERAGKEIMKLMSGDNPVDALKILFETGFYKSVFNVPSMEHIDPDGIMMDQKNVHHKYNLLDHTLNVVSNLMDILKKNNAPKDKWPLILFAAVFHDFGKMKKSAPKASDPNQRSYHDHQDESTIMADDILKSIGIGDDDRKMVSMIISQHMRPHDAYKINDQGKVEQWGRGAVGRFVRDTRPREKEEEYKDVWKYILWHAEADRMSSDPEKYDPKQTDVIYNMVNDFVQTPAAISPKPILNGNEIMSLFQDLNPGTGYIKEIQQKLIEMQDNGVIDMNYIKMPEGPEKEELAQITKSQAIEFVRSIAPEIISKYKEQPKMSMNWFKKVVSQSVQPGEAPSINDSEIVKGPIPQKHSYEVGMRVRDRRKGVANPQEYGVVRSIKDNKIIVEWNPNDKKNKKRQEFDLVEDTAELSFLIDEV